MVDTDRITGTAEELRGKAQRAVGDTLGIRTDSVEGRRREVAGAARDFYGQAKDAAKDAARDAVDTASDYAEDAYRQGRRYAVEGHQRSVEWPHASLLVAGLVGFGLGLLVSRI